MEIRDIIHGAIPIEDWELPIIHSKFFQRLRHIKQMGFADFSYPSATHTRYIHSLGAMSIATKVFETLFGNKPLSKDAYFRFKQILRFGALLHDVGHGPFSHTTEFAMPSLQSLGLPSLVMPPSQRKATHEDYTLKIILNSSLTPLLERAGRSFGFTPLHIASLIHHDIKINDDFFIESYQGEKIDFQTVLQQIVSSEMDADRMDYLQRDSRYSGVSYGNFDYDWLVSNLTTTMKNSKCHLALEHRALYSFEDFLISRYHMFLMVYFHHKSVIYDEMLAQYFHSDDCDFSLPSDIEQYAECNDDHLNTHLNKSNNVWAKRISEKRPYTRLIEIHSGIPTGQQARLKQEKILEELKVNLENQKIDFIEARTTGELSKYFGKPKAPIYVRYDNRFSPASTIALEDCTDLFEKYEEKRSIIRLYVCPEDLEKCQKLGREIDESAMIR